MKNTILTIVFASLIMVSCKKKEQIIYEEPPKVEEPANVAECYAYIKGKDTIQASLTIDGEKVNGDLAYRFFEKDKSSGVFKGIAKGDTLIGEYTFQSEGTQSVREVVFLRKDNTLIEGHGDIEEKEGKVIFKDKSALNFDGNLILKEVPCK